MRCFPILLLLLTSFLAFQTVAEATSSEGKTLFSLHCAACHGVGGAGDGPEAASLNTRPADLTKIASRRGGVWPVLEVMSIIDGYTRMDTPREDMPVISELSAGPVIEFDSGNGLATPVPERLLAVAIFLEEIQSPRPQSYVP